MERVAGPSVMVLFFFFLLSVLLSCVLVSEAQAPIPAKYDGFVYPGAAKIGGDDVVLVEAFFDPMCPDSRDSWPPLKQALRHYTSRIALIVHPFPLPLIQFFMKYGEIKEGFLKLDKVRDLVEGLVDLLPCGKAVKPPVQDALLAQMSAVEGKEVQDVPLAKDCV